jgi:hypothetical protein
MTLNDRALLLAYPAWFRRRYGDEILTTMMEMGPPTRHDRLRLIADGIAQRFRLPPRRPVAVLITMLIAVIAGAFGAAAGSWAAERTYASPPPLRQLARQITGGTALNDGFYDIAAHGFRMKTTTVMISRWDTGAVVAALSEAGWTVTADGVQNNVASSEQTIDDVPVGTGHRVEIAADKGGAHMRFEADVADVGDSQYSDTLVISAWPTDTGALLPFSIAGAALGVLIGWAAGAGLTGRRPPPAATVTAGLAITALVLPAYAISLRLALAVRNPAHPSTPTTDLHRVLLPGNGFWEDPMSQSWLLPGLSLAGAALTLVTVALLGRAGNTDEAIPVAG